MSEDVLLRQLGRVAREQAAAGEPSLDERWDRLAAGTLSADEEAELRRLGDASEEARQAYEAFRPLGPEFHAKVVQALAVQAEDEKRGKLLRFVRRGAAWGVSTAAAAAAVLAVVLPPALPTYAVAELSGGARMTRGEAVETATLRPGDTFHASLRPQTAVRLAGLLRAEAFLLRDDQVRPLDVRTTIDASGAARVSGTLDRDLSPGPWTLWLVVGRRGWLPNPERLRALPAGAPHRERKWVAVPASVTIGSSNNE